MLRVFLALNILLISLYACKGGYKTCSKKVRDSHAIYKQSLQIPISKTQKLIYSTKIPNAKVIKHDPFLNLYLVEIRHGFKFPFRMNYKLSLGQAAVNSKMAIEGRIKRPQIGLNKLASFTEVVYAPSLLLNSCCSLEGLITPRGIIQKKYIDFFLKSKKVEYGDIGIRVSDKKREVVIDRVNPFDDSIKLKKGDIVLYMDSKRIRNSAELMRKILFSKVGKKHRLKVKRGSKLISIDCVTKKRFGGGAISDTFLEEKGFYFSENLTIVKISDTYRKYGLKVGDILLQVNGKKVNTIDDVRNNIDDFKYHASLLFTRENFQFFVNIN